MHKQIIEVWFDKVTEVWVARQGSQCNYDDSLGDLMQEIAENEEDVLIIVEV